MKKSMRKIMAAALAGFMVLSLTACGGGDDKAAKSDSKASGDYAKLKSVELIGADSTGKDAAGQLFGELVAKKVSTITGGKLTIDYHPNGDLGGDEDLLRQMKSNDIQLVVSQTAPVVSFIPEVAVFDLPMAFAQYKGDAIDKVLNGKDSDFRKKLSEAYEKSGYHYLGILQNATFRLTTANKDLKTLEDYKSLKIRTMSNKNHMAFWTAIGAEPTPLAWPEVYFALQSGTVAAEENAADTIVGANLNEVQKYLACTNHILYANQICMNKKAYDGLDPAYQKALNQAVTEALAEMRPKLADIDKKNKDDLKGKGMTIINYDNAFFAKILELPGVKKLYSDIDGQVKGLGKVLMDDLKKVK
ncbi:MAG: TRAP transporter substrate-binding protein [Acidaminococcaceae bacterium]|jgi:tripartite ATP-independent transporter DctP family solute receptor|nr:TRAP transporter substrate-binding protein [Acidaminococcaceae bacterium]